MTGFFLPEVIRGDKKKCEEATVTLTDDDFCLMSAESCLECINRDDRCRKMVPFNFDFQKECSCWPQVKGDQRRGGKEAWDPCTLVEDSAGSSIIYRSDAQKNMERPPEGCEKTGAGWNAMKEILKGTGEAVMTEADFEGSRDVAKLSLIHI